MNKKETVYEALLGVKSEYLAEAEGFSFKKRRISWPRILGIAAAACLIIALAAIAITPKRDRDKWAANRPTSEPISTGGPTNSGAPVWPEGDLDEEGLLRFTRPTSLIEFFIAMDYEDERFEYFVRQNGYDRHGIRTEEDLVKTVQSMHEIPFPLREDAALREFRFMNDGNENYAYFALYRLPGGAKATFTGDLTTSIAQIELADGYTGVDVRNHRYIQYLYAREYDGYCSLVAEIDGHLVHIKVEELSRNDAVREILAFEFGGFAVGTPRIATVDADYDRLIFTDTDKLNRFIGSLDMSEEEFEAYIETELDERGISTQEDVERIVSYYNTRRFPLINGAETVTAILDYKTEYSAVDYDLGRGVCCSIDLFPRELITSIYTLLAYGIMPSEATKVELDPSSPFTSLYRIKDELRQGIEGSNYWIFAGEMGEYCVSITLDGYTLEEAVELFNSMEFGTVYELAGAEQTERMLFYSHKTLSEFIAARRLNDSDFDGFIKENSWYANSGIASQADVESTVNALESISFPIVGGRGFDFMSFDRRARQVSVEWDFVSKICRVHTFSEQSYGSLIELSGNDPEAWSAAFAVSLDAASPISELYGLKRQFVDYDGLVTPEAYEFCGRLKNGRFVRINTEGYEREAAEAFVKELKFDSLSMFIRTAENEKHDPVTLWFDSSVELAEFIASPELDDAAFARYIEGYPAIAGGKTEVRALVDDYAGSMHFPYIDGTEFSVFRLGVETKRVEIYYPVAPEKSIRYNCYPKRWYPNVYELSGHTAAELDNMDLILLDYDPSFPLMDFFGIRVSNGSSASPGDYAFYGELDGCLVEMIASGYTRDEAEQAVHSMVFGALDDAAAPQTALVNDPWYLETAWEYADFANREYGFGFKKDNAEFSAWDNRISFTHYELEDSEGQHISIYFKRGAKEIDELLIWGDASDRPEEYASMSEEERSALFNSVSMSGTYTVTREDMLNAGYTLDDTDADFVKIAEYCGRLKASELMSCNELHFYRCIEVDIGNVRRNTEDSVANSTDPVYCQLAYYFKPSYPKLFTDHNADIGCSMVLLDDAEHPGRISFWGDVLISETEDGWSCQLAYISGY